MADIKLERRERTVWPWVLVGVLIVALLVWFVADRGPRIAEMDVDAPPAAAFPTEELPPGEAGSFAAWVRDTDPRGEPGREHEYTADGIRQLANAIGDVTERESLRGQTLDEHVERMRAYADSLQRDSEALNHSRYARSAFLLGTELLEDIASTEYAEMDVGIGQTREAAGMVDASTPLLDQMDRVERFFANASEAVTRMARRVAPVEEDPRPAR